MVDYIMDWRYIEFFEMEHFDDPLYPGSGEFIDPLLVFALDALRRRTGWPIVPHVLNVIGEDGEPFTIGGAVDMYGEHDHATNSYHLKKNGCKACDFHFLTEAPIRLQYRAVEKMGFTGLGIYIKKWKWGGKILPAGFHVDFRPKEKIQRWSDRKGRKRIYLL